MWLIFPIMLLACLLMMFFCMRKFFGGHFGCCARRSYGWKGASDNIKPPGGAEAGRIGSRKEER